MIPQESSDLDKHIVAIAGWLYSLGYGEESLSTLSSGNQDFANKIRNLSLEIAQLAAFWNDADLREYYLSRFIQQRVADIQVCDTEVCVDSLNNIEKDFEQLYPLQSKPLPMHLDINDTLKTVESSLDHGLTEGLRDKVVADQLGEVLVSYGYQYCEGDAENTCQIKKETLYNTLLSSKKENSNWLDAFSQAYINLRSEVFESIVKNSGDIVIEMDTRAPLPMLLEGETEASIRLERQNFYQAHRLANAVLNWQEIEYSDDLNSLYQQRTQTLTTLFLQKIRQAEHSEDSSTVVKQMFEDLIHVQAVCNTNQDTCVELVNNEVAAFVAGHESHSDGLAKMKEFKEALLNKVFKISSTKRAEFDQKIENDRRLRMPHLVEKPIFESLNEAQVYQWLDIGAKKYPNNKVSLGYYHASMLAKKFFEGRFESDDGLIKALAHIIANDKIKYKERFSAFTLNDLMSLDVMYYLKPFFFSGDQINFKLYELMGGSIVNGDRRESLFAWFVVDQLDEKLKAEGASSLTTTDAFKLFMEIKVILDGKSDKTNRMTQVVSTYYLSHAPKQVWLQKGGDIENDIIELAWSFAQGGWDKDTPHEYQVVMGGHVHKNTLKKRWDEFKKDAKRNGRPTAGYNTDKGFGAGAHPNHMIFFNQFSPQTMKPDFTNLNRGPLPNARRPVALSNQDLSEMTDRFVTQTNSFLRSSSPNQPHSMSPYPELGDILEARQISFPEMPDRPDVGDVPPQQHSSEPIIRFDTEGDTTNTGIKPAEKSNLGQAISAVVETVASGFGKVIGSARANPAIVYDTLLTASTLPPRSTQPVNLSFYNYEKKGDAEFLAEIAANSSTRLPEHRQEDLSTWMPAQPDVDLIRIEGRPIVEELNQRLETPAEQPGVNLDRTILPIVAPLATMYFRSKEPSNLAERPKGDAWQPISTPRQHPLDSNVESLTGRLYVPHEKHIPAKNGANGRWGEDATVDPIPDLKTGQFLLDTAYTNPKHQESTKGPLYTYYQGKIIAFRGSNFNNEWHAYEIDRKVSNDVGQDVLKKFREDGLISNSEYKKLLKL